METDCMETGLHGNLAVVVFGAEPLHGSPRAVG